MATVGSYEAKTHLPELLRRVEAGERIEITRHGRVVAHLVPPDRPSGRSVAEVVADLLDFGQGRALGPDLSVRDLIEEGRE
jgi:prevent-host-death family protein